MQEPTSFVDAYNEAKIAKKELVTVSWGESQAQDQNFPRPLLWRAVRHDLGTGTEEDHLPRGQAGSLEGNQQIAGVNGSQCRSAEA